MSEMPERRLLLLGTPRVEVGGATAHVERRKSIALLAFLAVSGDAYSRDSLASTFWPDHDTSRGLAYLRNTFWTLSKSLGDDWLISEGDTVRFNGMAGISRDVTDFRTLVANGLRLNPSDADGHQGRARLLAEAVSVYRGDFMAGFSLRDSPDFDNWQVFEAEHLRHQMNEALDKLVESYIALGDFDQGIAAARRWVLFDPLREHAHRQLMRLYAWAGQTSAALRQYRELIRTLESELGTVPDPESRRLYDAITNNRLPLPSLVTAPTTSVAPVSGTASPAPTAEVAPPPALTAGNSNLPPNVTAFIGRTAELAELHALLNDPDCRLLTIVAPGGMGKTRLAIEAARTGYEGDTYFVPLAPIISGEFILSSVAAAIGFSFGSSAEYQQQLFHHMQSRRMLLVIDNFEHLIDHAMLLSDILSHAPQVKVLVTSRERLNVQEEYVYELNGLSVPVNGVTEAIESFDAVALFVQAARRVRPGFGLMNGDGEAVIRISRAVDGMPLGIELAATWMSVLSPAEIAAEIERSLDFLTTTARNVPERHRSLRNVFERSWVYLSTDERACLSQLSVFRGGFSIAAAQAVTAAPLGTILTLHQKSLIRRMANCGGRFELHELIRQYAEQKMTDAERQEALDRHSVYYLSFVAGREPALKGRDMGVALDEIEQDADNVRQAWVNGIKRRDVASLQASLDALIIFSFVRDIRLLSGIADHSDASLRFALEAFSEGDHDEEEAVLRGRLLALQATLLERGGTPAQIHEVAQQSVSLLHRVPGHPKIATALVLMGDALSVPGRAADFSVQLVEEALAILRRSGDRWGEAYALLILASVLHAHIQYEQADRLYQQSLRLFRETKNVWGEGLAINGLSRQAYTLGEFLEARRLISIAIPLFEQIGDRRRVGFVRNMLIAKGESETAFEPYNQMLRLYDELGDVRGAAWTRYNLGWLSWLIDDFTQASSLFAQAFAGFQSCADGEGMAWVRIYQADTALALGDPTEASLLALEAMEAIEDLDLPWCTSGALLVLGDVAFAQGNLDAARQKYRDAVRIAYQVRSIMQTLRHLSGFAALLLHKGNAHGAVALATFIIDHEATWKDTIKRLTPLLASAGEQLPPADFAAAQAEGRTYSLDSIVQRFVVEDAQP